MGEDGLRERIEAVLNERCRCGKVSADEIVAALSSPERGETSERGDIDALREENARLRAWVDKRKEREKRSRDRYRAAHPEVHRKSARESMRRLRAARASSSDQAAAAEIGW